jgi:hypothetical protein
MPPNDSVGRHFPGSVDPGYVAAPLDPSFARAARIARATSVPHAMPAERAGLGAIAASSVSRCAAYRCANVGCSDAITSCAAVIAAASRDANGGTFGGTR